MADTKISALPAVTTPVAGASELPIVQGGTTKKVTILQLTGTQVSAAGDVGVGGDTSGVVAGVAITSKFCVKNEGANPVAGFVHVNDTTAGSGSITFACRSRGTLAVPTVVQNNDSLWNMYIAGNDGTDLALAAEIRVEVDGTPGSNDMPGRIVLGTTPDGTQSPVDRMKIDNAGDVTVITGNLVIGTSGKGIDFSADPHAAGMTSELLDDYEEGTWTPVYAGGVSAVTYGSVQAGHYRKIGSQVTVWFGLMTNALTINSANLVISGLPFTASASAGAQGTVNLSDASRWDSTPPVQGRVEPNSTVIYLLSNIGPTGAGVDPVDITTASLDTGSGNRNRCFGTATYFV